MYSYEDRVRAVELYIKLGKRVRVTCLNNVAFELMDLNRAVS